MTLTRRNCPRCNEFLRPLKIEEKTEVDYCDRWGGSYFDANESEEIFGPIMAEDVWTDAGIC